MSFLAILRSAPISVLNVQMKPSILCTRGYEAFDEGAEMDVEFFHRTLSRINFDRLKFCRFSIGHNRQRSSVIVDKEMTPLEPNFTVFPPELDSWS